MELSFSGQCDVGIAGGDGLGRNIARNISSHLIKVAAWNSCLRAGMLADRGTQAEGIHQAETLSELAGLLSAPRTIVICGETSRETDEIINGLLPTLSARDILIDAGDSLFVDATCRSRILSERGIELICVGITQGGAGRRSSAMIMTGGRSDVCARAQPLLGMLAGDGNGQARVGHVGSAGAVCFARMVHAALDHTLMQLVSEAFELMQRTLKFAEDSADNVSRAGHVGALSDYLADVSGHLLNPQNHKTELCQIREQVDVFKRSAGAICVSQVAKELGVPAPTIDAALCMEGDSARERERSLILTPFRHPSGRSGSDTASVVDELLGALYAAMIIAYAEGFAILSKGSARHQFRFDIVEMAQLWKSGCAVRAGLLDDIAAALWATPSLESLVSDEDLAEKLMGHQEYLRRAVWRASELDLVVPGLLAALDYLDSFRDAWLPVNLVQVRPNPKNRVANQTREMESRVSSIVGELQATNF